LLEIRPEQMQALREATNARLARRCARFVREKWDDVYAVWTDEELTTELVALVEFGRECGMSTERSLIRLTNLAAVLGFGFQRRRAWARIAGLLRSDDLPIDTRFRIAYGRIEAETNS
jgi:hypothetical protein